MSRQKTHHTKQFKLDAINYRKEHPDLTQVECAKNLGIGVSFTGFSILLYPAKSKSQNTASFTLISQNIRKKSICEPPLLPLSNCLDHLYQWLLLKIRMESISFKVWYLPILFTVYPRLSATAHRSTLFAMASSSSVNLPSMLSPCLSLLCYKR